MLGVGLEVCGLGLGLVSTALALYLQKDLHYSTKVTEFMQRVYNVYAFQLLNNAKKSKKNGPWSGSCKTLDCSKVVYLIARTHLLKLYSL